MLSKDFGFFEQGIAFLRFGNKCFKCKDICRTVDLELDHTFAKSLGGKHKNFTVLCGRCNKRKNSKTIEQAYHPEEIKALEEKLSLQFTEDEIIEALIILLKDEIEYAKKSGEPLSEAAKRLTERKYIRERL